MIFTDNGVYHALKVNNIDEKNLNSRSCFDMFDDYNKEINFSKSYSLIMNSKQILLDFFWRNKFRENLITLNLLPLFSKLKSSGSKLSYFSFIGKSKSLFIIVKTDLTF